MGIPTSKRAGLLPGTTVNGSRIGIPFAFETVNITWSMSSSPLTSATTWSVSGTERSKPLAGAMIVTTGGRTSASFLQQVKAIQHIAAAIKRCS